jgi:hypothetical protein
MMMLGRGSMLTIAASSLASRLRWIGPHDHLEKPHGRFLLI